MTASFEPPASAAYRPAPAGTTALASAVRVSFEPKWSESPGTLFVESDRLAFFPKDDSATLAVTLGEIGEATMKRVGPVDAIVLDIERARHYFLVREAEDFFEALCEIRAQRLGAQPSARLNALSEQFSARAAEIVDDSFTIGTLFGNAEAAESFTRLLRIVVGA
ncbi:MAG TPA: hypothetical protein VMF61_12350 [Candidatus Acidoferrales bacterium]|nr:hypothetical protein [Candidatus Acidoferrales bacterium]